MIKDPAAVADDAATTALQALERDGSELVILGCTIIAGCLELGILRSGQHAELPILNPNLMALKAAESLADLFLRGRYTISRRGFYQRHDQHDAVEAADVASRFRLVDLAADRGHHD